MRFIGVIPARLASTRLAEKVLKPIAGIPMIQHVWKRASEATKLEKVIVACDDARIESCVKEFGGHVMMTRKDHPNGTSRIAEVARTENADVFINIQGDEPLIDPANINRLAEVFEKETEAEVATLAVEGFELSEFEDPNVVKVVLDEYENALYFSRSPIPYPREKGKSLSFLKHIGIYGYKKSFLLEFVDWAEGKLESTEKLEQLRILEKGRRLRVARAVSDSLSVDTEEDLKAVEAKMSRSH